jgi:cytochrome c553
MRLGWLLPSLTVGALLTGAAVSAPGPAPAAAPATAEQARFFETSIRPVLVEQCLKCHGPDQQSGKLRVDSLAALLKGGGRGTSLTPAHPEQSLLLKVVMHVDGTPKMPPGKKLSDKQIADLAHWVQMGSPWPAAGATGQALGGKDRAKHWAFQPVKRPAIPSVKNKAWVKTPIDAFILSELEKQGLKPAPAADKRTLLRRASFDLTGLPPTPAEIDAFVNDKSPDAWDKVIERLLASPAYGERWGRHWLDLARYADSNGLDENVHYGNAWRYRDWVVSAFNRDLPYNQFLTDQLAGDLLPATQDVQEHNDRLIATGFLAVGPKFISEVDTQKVLMDMADEQLDTLGRTTMGLTLGCARCHDHKFDPISTKDYYALAGIFKSTKTLEVLKKPRMWWEYPVGTAEDQAKKAEYDRKLAAQKEAVAALIAKGKEQCQAANPGKALPKSPETVFPADLQAELKKRREELAALEKSPPEMPMAMGLTEGEVADLPVHIRGSHLTLGDMVPRRFPTVLASTVSGSDARFDKQQSGRLQLAEWLTRPEHPLTGRVVVNRVWRWHFGHGIVRTVDNFGLLGEEPTNPALLDYLATAFVSGVPSSEFRVPGSPASKGNVEPGTRNSELNWSFKNLHRLIMRSSTYQMSAAQDPRALKIDPENRLYSRAELQRLDVEELRDSILSVSGLLDRSMGGRALGLKNREYVFDHTSKDGTKYDIRRRTIYLPVVRNNLYDVFQLFDFGDASITEGNRPTTTVAPQALFLMNGDVALDAAESMAANALKRTDLDAPRRINLLYQQAYGRPATAAEQKRAAATLTRFEQVAGQQKPDPAARQSLAWSWYCHVLLASNEFVYVN